MVKFFIKFHFIQYHKIANKKGVYLEKKATRKKNFNS